MVISVIKNIIVLNQSYEVKIVPVTLLERKLKKPQLYKRKSTHQIFNSMERLVVSIKMSLAIIINKVIQMFTALFQAFTLFCNVRFHFCPVTYHVDIGKLLVL
mmetsp:Transcript_8761/g.18923  ORF Transcript_8761/g.18923 Transcript_8761/m.18923 type:complete len:103 (-) Transcript_8761:1716-2024(-)